MRTWIVGLTLVAAASQACAQDQVVKSKIIAAGLFKNGLSVIKREVALPGPGTFRLDDVPDPVHGTWWIESDAQVETTSKMREVEVPIDGDVNFQRDLVNRKVTVYFKGGRPDPVSGIVLKTPAPKEDSVARDRILVLKTAKGRMFIDSGEISIIDAEGENTVKKQRKPVLFLHAPKAKENDKLFVSYLTHGLAWAPSYRVDITDPKVLTLEQAAVVKNELADFADAELKLISGFPSVEMAHVRSPLSPRQTWANFFQEITAEPGQSHGYLTQRMLANPMMSNQAVPAEFGLKIGATPMGEGVDLHYQPIGKRTLAKGEALSLSIARKKAAYERIVEWMIPDNRDGYGRYGLESDEAAWDALRFKNPFSFPMTTGPAMINADGKFNGQRASNYVSAGEETMLRITKALSIRTRHVEQEVQGKEGERDFIYVGGHRYMKSTVKAELTVANHRKEAVKLVIRRCFSGDLISADAQPRITLRKEGVYSVNRRNEMTWVIALKGGEERQLNYRYSVLVMH